MESCTIIIILLYLDGPVFDVASRKARCVWIGVRSVVCFVKLNTRVTIDCLIDSFPEAVAEIGDLPESRNVQVDGTRITINGVTMDNIGTQECLASNIVAGSRVVRALTIIMMEGGK